MESLGARENLNIESAPPRHVKPLCHPCHIKSYLTMHYVRNLSRKKDEQVGTLWLKLWSLARDRKSTRLNSSHL